MKTIIKSSLIIASMIISTAVFAQKEKKTQSFTVSRVIEASASDVWAVVGEDFGGISKSHHKIVSSNYNNGHISGGEGCDRTCNYNSSGSKYVKEKQTSYDPDNYTFEVKIYEAGGFPLDLDVSVATYQVKPIDENSSELVFEMNYRTKPAFMGALSKGKFKKIISEYQIAVEHYVLTGEEVTAENFKEIKKKYKG